MREVDFAKQKTEGEIKNEKIVYFLSPSQKSEIFDSPLVRGGRRGVYEKFTENTQIVLAFLQMLGYTELALGEKEC